MKAINFNSQEIELNHASQITAGYGHKKITVELCYEGEYKEFHAVTANMPDFDDAMDLEDYDEKQLALYNLIEYKIEDEVQEWIDSL
ncbi:hypothetical protein [Soonwooa sp.]|uniref:hypothetical protein n=1 Tax=Soonwooa sp. TaxID=1938592 RepID=UPI0028AB4399|nr:hypothetical protein [Soonwooa sp.]